MIPPTTYPALIGTGVQETDAVAERRCEFPLRDAGEGLRPSAGFRATIYGLLCGALCALFVAAPARAVDVVSESVEKGAVGTRSTRFGDMAGSSDVVSYTGDFVHDVPIQVPSFLGNEPPLSLSYASSGDVGLVGSGWRLAGPSIDRRSDTGGLPAGDAGDTW